MSSRHLITASERSKLDPFVVATGDASPRDQRDLMERPFFSLAKKPRLTAIEYKVGDVEVEEACGYLFDHGIPAYPYTTEKPVAVLGAKYKWSRAAGLL